MTGLLFAVEALAFLGLFGVICRLDQLTWRTHQAAVVAMHIGMGLGCLWALLEAAEGTVTLGGIGAVVSTVCWLWTSLPTWAFGPPSHTLTQPHDAKAVP